MSVRRSFGFPLNVAVHSDVGRVRTNNEDSSGKAWLADGSLFVIVADGMGGHEAGEVASGLAVQVVEEVMQRDLSADPRERLYNGLLEANEAILEEGRASGTRGMGTTAITGLVRGNEVHIGQVGDSRLYHIRKGHLVWRTLDHTRVQMLIDNGELTDEAARNHPEAGMLTRALGHSRMADGRPLAPDVLAEPLHIEERDTLVLCSDGLHDLLEDWEIAQLVAGRAPEEAAKALVEEACARGGHDNVTVAVIVAGERATDFDADFVPDSGHPEPTDDVPSSGIAEVTYDELPAQAEQRRLAAEAASAQRPAPVSTAVMSYSAAAGGQLEPGGPMGGATEAPRSNTGMMMALGAAGVVVVVVVLVVVVVAVGVGIYFYAG